MAHQQKLFCSALAVLAISVPVSASAYVDVGVTAGYSAPEVVAGQAAPRLVQYGANATLGFKLKRLILGASTVYRIAEQYSSTGTIVGNFAGSRWNRVSPVLGLEFARLIVKAEADFLGTYKLSSRTNADETVQYIEPVGGRLSLMFPLGRGRWMPGVFYEQLFFEKLRVTNFEDQVVSPKLKFWQVGLALNVRLQ